MTGSQTILPTTLYAGDVLVLEDGRWRVSRVAVRPCPISPRVAVDAYLLPDGPARSMWLDADVYVPVEVPDAS